MNVADWEELARTQGCVDVQRMKEADPGTTFALEDRNTTAESWRRVFVVAPEEGEEDALVFDTRWRLIHEASAGVVRGKQPWVDLQAEFGDPDSEEGVYYRTPHLRRPLHRSVSSSPAGARTRMATHGRAHTRIAAPTACTVLRVPYPHQLRLSHGRYTK